MMHTILGAGGSIAKELMIELQSKKVPYKIVSRNPQPVMGAETVKADLTQYNQVLAALNNSAVVYLVVGLKYNSKIWETEWPLVMNNVIQACKEVKARLVFFDNVYMYGKVTGVMTEETAFNPNSKKGLVRAAIVEQLLAEMKTGALTALIARSADFYGPSADKNSVPNMLVFQNILKKKNPQWLLNADLPHSFTFTTDAARALYLLAITENAYGQTWHLPTKDEPITGKTFIRLATAAMHVPNRYSILSKWMIRLAGLFIPDIRETYEMLYQNEVPYIFDSSKFEKTFNFKPTSYEEGIQKTAAYFLNN
jgi:nucleoside-diphosphate-sugar epimerase